jgi:hypothetical protein
MLCVVCVVRVCDLADDNVHLQNAAELSKVLVRQGIDFEQMYYTNCILSPQPFSSPLFCACRCVVVVRVRMRVRVRVRVSPLPAIRTVRFLDHTCPS